MCDIEAMQKSGLKDTHFCVTLVFSPGENSSVGWRRKTQPVFLLSSFSGHLMCYFESPGNICKKP